MNPYFRSLDLFKKKIIATLKDIELTILDESIRHEIIVSNATYSPWGNDQLFLKTYNIIKNNTLVDIYRCYALWDFLMQNNDVQGHILEIGVWKGGTGCLLAKAASMKLPDYKVYLVDTFEGVVKAGSEDTNYKGGEHADTNKEVVLQLIEKLHLSNTKVLEGIFPDDINFNELNIENQVKLCHIDVDTYQSAKDIFEYIWPHIIKGGAVIFDDYGFWGCEGVTKLVNQIKPINAVSIYNLNGQSIFIKL
jgi:O-methyltransferase